MGEADLRPIVGRGDVEPDLRFRPLILVVDGAIQLSSTRHMTRLPGRSVDADPREVDAGHPVDELVVDLVRASREVLLPPAADIVDGAIDLVRVLLDGEAGGVVSWSVTVLSPVRCLHDASENVADALA